MSKQDQGEGAAGPAQCKPANRLAKYRSDRQSNAPY